MVMGKKFMAVHDDDGDDEADHSDDVDLNENIVPEF
jgi:hypothetical protein